MTALNSTIVIEFCKLCNWSYEAWITHRALFDANPKVKEMMEEEYNHFFSRLSIITQEYALNQLIKLHDPAVQRNDINLTFEFIIEYGNWDKKTLSKLKQLYKKMQNLPSAIKPARNKLLSHNDLKTIINKSNLGAFKEELDIEYFNLLQEFVDIVHNKYIGGPYPFNDLAEADVEIFLEKLNKKIT